MKKNALVRSIIFGLICLFCICRVSQMAIAEDQSSIDVSTLYIPEYYGKVEQQFAGTSGRIVIHIQDAHCDYVAQKNIVKLIKSFVENYHIRLVTVEGSKGDINTTLLASYPDKEVKQNVADYFLKIGQVTGPEYLSVNSQTPFFLVGIENRNLYVENVDAFRKAFNDREKTENVLDFFNLSFTQLKNKLYSKNLKLFSDVTLKYENEEISFSDYSSQLMLIANAQKIKLDAYPQFQQLSHANELADALIFEDVDKERAEILKILPLKMKGKDLQEFISLSLKFKEKEISYLKYYLYLKDQLQKYGIATDRLPNFLRYTNYLELLSSLDKQKVSKEEEALLRKILKKLSSTKEETLFVLDKNARILSHLFEIRMARDEYLFYKDNKDKFKASRFDSFIANESVKYGLHLGKVDNPEILDQEAGVASHFYELALKRENVFVDQVLSEMARRNVDAAVLVAGGFHSAGIINDLKNKDISYIVVSPITDKQNQAEIASTYNALLSDKKLPFQTFLDNANVPDAVPAVISFLFPESTKRYVLNKVSRKYLEDRAYVLAFDSLFNKMIETEKSDAFVTDFVSKLVNLSRTKGENLAQVTNDWIRLYTEQKNGMAELARSLGITDQTIIDSFKVDPAAVAKLINDIVLKIDVSVEGNEQAFPSETGNISRVTFKDTGATIVYHYFDNVPQKTALARVYSDKAIETIDSRGTFFKSMELGKFLKCVTANIGAFFGDALLKKDWRTQLKRIEDNWGLSKEQRQEFFTGVLTSLEEEMGVNENQIFAIDFDLLQQAQGVEVILDAYKRNKKAQLVVFGVKEISKRNVETFLTEKGYQDLTSRLQITTFDQLPNTVTSVVVAEKNKDVKDNVIAENLWRKDGRWNIIAKENSYLPVLFDVLSSIKSDRTLDDAIVSLKEVLNMDENEIRELLSQPFPDLVKATSLINNVSFAKEAVARAA